MDCIFHFELSYFGFVEALTFISELDKLNIKSSYYIDDNGIVNLEFDLLNPTNVLLVKVFNISRSVAINDYFTCFYKSSTNFETLEYRCCYETC